MYNTIIRQQHIIDRTEQERVLLSFIAQKYYKTKCSITERRNAHPVRGMMLLKHRVTAHRLRIEKNSTEGRYIDAKCIKSVS